MKSSIKLQNEVGRELIPKSICIIITYSLLEPSSSLQQKAMVNSIQQGVLKRSWALRHL